MPIVKSISNSRYTVNIMENEDTQTKWIKLNYKHRNSLATKK